MYSSVHVCQLVAMSEVYDVIMVGAGIVGSSTAYHLIKNGAGNCKVLLLEQFSSQHTRGSSHSSSRITRRAYEDSFFVRMMDEAYVAWERLEKESGSKLYIRTGHFIFGPKGCIALKKVIEVVKTNGVQHEIFSGEEAMRRYPTQLQFPPDYQCVFEEDGGILLASKALAAFQKLFVEAGGILLDNHPVSDITPGHVISVKTANGDVFQTRKIVITAGAWAPRIMRALGVELPFKITKTGVYYWKVNHPEHFSSDNFPVFCNYTEKDDKNIECYGTPVHEFPGLLKVCLRTGTVVDPDHCDTIPTHQTTEAVAQVIRKYFKNVSTTPSIYESCMYTNSPDYHPVLDRHPLHSNIVVAAGFSGHGFKLSPVVGKILSELALDTPPSYDLSPFKIDRFKPEHFSEL